jgi:hypothetical protein
MQAGAPEAARKQFHAPYLGSVAAKHTGYAKSVKKAGVA